MSSPLFGLLPAGHPLLTDPSSTPSPTSLLYSLPTSKPFSHLTVFLLPGVDLPSDTAAAIYLASQPSDPSSAPNFKFLGAIGPGKESAVFSVGSSQSQQQQALIVGISVEPAGEVAPKLQELAANKANKGSGGGAGQPSTVVLAQRIIQNAFNFLTSFSGTAGPGGVEVVPLKAFEEWWKKFEGRVRTDPSFLERQQD
ncbi:hypothetical protein NLU13_4980 [Sarocladium strictum]|uniref:Hikeshi-like domain-containing protein n=1 Tax=Sarocladium strictum TaxID=5046 RepID=A0AA39GMJ6_SARSR|nr:hypothetical protein NLU13_4980 [Sarocladium strictum]